MTKKHKMGHEALKVTCEMMKKTMRLKEELKTRSPCNVIMYGKVISKSSKLCCD